MDNNRIYKLCYNIDVCAAAIALILLVIFLLVFQKANNIGIRICIIISALSFLLAIVGFTFLKPYCDMNNIEFI